MKIYQHNLSYYKSEEKLKSSDTFAGLKHTQYKDSFVFLNEKLKKNAYENVSFKGLFDYFKKNNEPVFTEEETFKKLRAALGLKYIKFDKTLNSIKQNGLPKDKYSQDLVKKTIWMGKAIAQHDKCGCLDDVLPEIMKLCFVNNKFDERIYDDVIMFLKKGQSIYDIKTLINSAKNPKTQKYNPEVITTALRLLEEKKTNFSLHIAANSVDENGKISDKMLQENLNFVQKYNQKGLFLLQKIRKENPKNAFDFGALETVKTLLDDTRIPLDKVYIIMSDFNGKFQKEALDSLTKHIPDDLTDERRGEFILLRLNETLNPDKTLNKEL